MRYQLEPLLRVGTRQVAVISRIQTGHHRFFCTHVFQGEKTPAYFFLKSDEEIELLDASGSKVAREDIESTCPEIAANAFEILNAN